MAASGIRLVGGAVVGSGSPEPLDVVLSESSPVSLVERKKPADGLRTVNIAGKYVSAASWTRRSMGPMATISPATPVPSGRSVGS